MANVLFLFAFLFFIVRKVAQLINSLISYTAGIQSGCHIRHLWKIDGGNRNYQAATPKQDKAKL